MSKRAYDKIAEGLKEAIAIARGKAKPAKLYVPPEIPPSDSLERKRELCRERPAIWHTSRECDPSRKDEHETEDEASARSSRND
jgi:hypothetical protein